MFPTVGLLHSAVSVMNDLEKLSVNVLWPLHVQSSPQFRED